MRPAHPHLETYSISNEGQRQIDRVQPTGGVHIGNTVGDVELMSLRPFSRTHLGLVGESINMAGAARRHRRRERDRDEMGLSASGGGGSASA